MTIENELMRYGRPKKIADYLEKSEDVSNEELVNALINALHRIQRLEKIVGDYEKNKNKTSVV